jgi:hypothetical protein
VVLQDALDHGHAAVGPCAERGDVATTA